MIKISRVSNRSCLCHKANHNFFTYTAKAVQVVLAGTSIKAVAAVKDLIYSGTCHLDEVSKITIKTAVASYFI